MQRILQVPVVAAASNGSCITALTNQLTLNIQLLQYQPGCIEENNNVVWKDFFKYVAAERILQ